jgi:colanic acid biosynthesis glycosyl transferase WcaI
MKHILLLSLWYYPEPVAKPHDLAVELVKRGYQVTVITGFPNYPQGNVYAGYRLRPLQRETIDGVTVLRVPFIIDRSGSGVRRILSYVSFTVTAVLSSLLVRGVSAVWTYQIGLPGVLVKWLKGIPWVHEVQDLWPDWAQTADMGLRPWWFGVLERQEKFIYRVANAIVTISNGFMRTLQARGVPTAKLHVFPNWANEENFRPVTRDEALASREGLADHFNVMYGGNIGTAQALHVTLDAAAALTDYPDVQFVLIGDGVERSRLEEEAKQRGLDNVRFLGGRPQTEIAAYFAWANILFIHLKHNPEYEITIPSKTYAYLASGRPILAAAGGDVVQLLREINAGLVCAPEDATALAETVRAFYQMPEIEREAMGQRGRQAFLLQFAQNITIQRYDKLFTQLTRGD